MSGACNITNITSFSVIICNTLQNMTAFTTDNASLSRKSSLFLIGLINSLKTFTSGFTCASATEPRTLFCKHILLFQFCEHQKWRSVTCCFFCVQDEKAQTVTSHIWTQMVRVCTACEGKEKNYDDSLSDYCQRCLHFLSSTFLVIEKCLTSSSQYWQNEFLTWNPSDYCGIKMLAIPRSMLWIPDVTILEEYVQRWINWTTSQKWTEYLFTPTFSPFSTSDTGSVQDSPLVGLYPGGLMFTNRHQVLTSTCQLNLFLFPFDTQYCNITFSSFNYEGESHHTKLHTQLLCFILN